VDIKLYENLRFSRAFLPNFHEYFLLLELKNECFVTCSPQARNFSGFDPQNHQKYEENR